MFLYVGKKWERFKDQCAYLAHNAGHFAAELAPIALKGKKGKEESMDMDEHPRDTTIETLAKLPSVFKKDGLVTAGSASGRP